jgi:AcrR family transcriptional regulator
MLSTKQRILDSSVKLFNEFGVDAVRLQQIAEDTGISVGNLAYHYKSKDAIVESVYEQVLDEFAHIFRQYLQSPDLTDFDQQLSRYYQFFKANQFYIAGFLKVAPEPASHAAAWQEAIGKMRLQLRSWLLFHRQRQTLHNSLTTSQYDPVAESLWMLLIFQPLSCTLRGQVSNETSYKQAVWRFLTPYFTEQGLAEYRAEVLPLLTD